jgi:hypothetical protein
MDNPHFVSWLLTDLYAACKICVLVLSDDKETQMFLSSMYITMVEGEMFSIDRLVWCSLVAMFCMCKKTSAVYRDNASPEIGDPCDSLFRTGLMFVQCPSRHIWLLVDWIRRMLSI